MGDHAGNTLSDARKLRLGSTTKTIRDTVSARDANDFYRVRLKQKSKLTLKLSNLEANANLELLKKNGNTVARSARRGTRRETIKEKVSDGVYYIRVYPKGKAKTKYKLTGSADSVSTNSGSKSTFNIQFDYRFDSAGWFTSERRTLLNVAAEIWEAIIQDEFANVPAGTSVRFTNPTTGSQESFNLNTEIDDLLVFAGTGQTRGGLAIGGPFGSWIVGSSLDKRFNGADFEPWTGDISFDPNANWFFDKTPDTAGDIPRNANDFLSVAVHELGHVLGIGTSDAFDNLISNSQFTGANTKRVNGGQSIPLDFFGGHIKDDFVPTGQTGESAMDPTLLVGTRKLPSRLDIALLNDIGYTVDYSKAASNARPSRSLSQRSQAVSICGCAACLASSRKAQVHSSDRALAVRQAQPLAAQDSVLKRVLRLTNRERKQAGLAPLSLNSKLTKIAQNHSADMAKNDFMSHISSDGSDLGDRLGERNYLFAWANENVASGYKNAREVVDLWLNSPLHRANLLSEEATELGVGYKFLKKDTGTFNYNHYWTLTFARPLSS